VVLSDSTTIGTVLTGGAGVDTFTGTGGADIFHGGSADVLTGNSGADTFNFAAAVTSGTVVGGAGADIVTFSGATNTATINDATIAITGGTGVDTITFDTTVATAVTVTGGTGADVIALVAGTNAGVVINDSDGFTLTGGTINTVNFVNSNAGLAATSITGGSGVDTYTFGTGSNVATITGGNGIDVIDAGASHTGGMTFITGSAAANADLVSNFISSGSVDVIDLSAALTAVTLTVGTQIAAGAAANNAAAIALVTAAADTDAEVYYIENTALADGVMSLADIETAITAGGAATGQVTVIVDNGTSTFVYTDQAAQTDAGSGAGLILQVTLVGITGATAVATGDFIST
jgi:hypothetical protein